MAQNSRRTIYKFVVPRYTINDCKYLINYAKMVGNGTELCYKLRGLPGDEDSAIIGYMRFKSGRSVSAVTKKFPFFIILSGGDGSFENNARSLYDESSHTFTRVSPTYEHIGHIEYPQYTYEKINRPSTYRVVEIR